ncbi:MAG: hypothetical protein QOH97_1421 [Actinoplanes sp.]|nr:hypothetical protein [Actinoplanes sp.]
MTRARTAISGTIAGVFPSTPSDGDRDPWDADNSRHIARSAPSRSSSGFYAGAPEGESGTISSRRPRSLEDVDDAAVHDGIEIVPVRRNLSLAIAGFAALLGVGLILGAQSSGPDARLPYAIVIFGVQLMFVLAWTMAIRPPAPGIVASVCAVVALGADYSAVSTAQAGLAPLGYVAAGGFLLAVLGQLIRRAGRARVTDSLGSTLLIVIGVVSFASLIVLTRKPIGTQTVLVCLAAAGVGVFVARLTDAVFAKPRLAPQVPRGASGIILGAMLGTLTAAVLGSWLVLPFNPGKGAVLGLITAGVAVLVDLAVDYAETSRNMAGDAPTFWLARHMQGPLGAFALASPAAYALAIFFLS